MKDYTRIIQDSSARLFNKLANIIDYDDVALDLSVSLGHINEMLEYFYSLGDFDSYNKLVPIANGLSNKLNHGLYKKAHYPTNYNIDGIFLSTERGFILSTESGSIISI